MSILERQQNILRMLNDNGKVTVSMLKDEFGVTERTIRSDILNLSRLYPIESVPGRNGGIRFMDGFRGERRWLSSDEVNLLKELADDTKDKKRKLKIMNIIASFSPDAKEII